MTAPDVRGSRTRKRLVVMDVVGRPTGRTGTRIHRAVQDIPNEMIDQAIANLSETGI